MYRCILGVLLSLMYGVALAAPALADTLVLKDGTAVQGQYKGGSSNDIQFEAAGVTKAYPLNTVTTLTLSPRAEPTAAATAAAAAPVATAAAVPAATAGAAAAAPAAAATAAAAAPAAPAGAPLTAPVTVTAGTKLMIKFASAVSTATHPEGASFQVVLEQDLVANGMVAAAKGTPVYGKVVEARGGKKVGAQYLKLTLTGLSIKNQNVPITTEVFGVEGGKGKTAKTVGAAALVGAAIDGGSGAATGAAVGGAVALLTPGQHVQFPAGTLLEVPLKDAVTINP
jgi:hypothetical protein